MAFRTVTFAAFVAALMCATSDAATPPAPTVTGFTVKTVTQSTLSNPVPGVTSLVSSSRVQKPRGIAVDQKRGVLWVADNGGNQMVSINTTSWAEAVRIDDDGTGAKEGPRSMLSPMEAELIRGGDYAGQLIGTWSESSGIVRMLKPDQHLALNSTRLAGGDVRGDRDGTLGAASFTTVTSAAMALGRTNSVLVCDYHNNCVREVYLAEKRVQTVVGLCGRTTSSMKTPWGIAASKASNEVYVSSTANNRIHRIRLAAQGSLTAVDQFEILVGNGAAEDVDGHADAASTAIKSPSTMARYGDVLFIGTNTNAITLRAYVISTGHLKTLVSSTAQTGLKDGDQTAAQINRMHFIAPVSQTVLFVSDTANEAVRRLTIDWSGYDASVKGPFENYGQEGDNDGKSSSSSAPASAASLAASSKASSSASSSAKAAATASSSSSGKADGTANGNTPDTNSRSGAGGLFGAVAAAAAAVLLW